MIDVQVDAQGLREALANCVATRGTLPILEHALIIASEDGLRVVTTDHQKWVTQLLAASSNAPGKITAHAAKLRAALTGLDGDVLLSLKKDKLTLSSGRLRYTIPTLPPQDFPDAKELKPERVDFDPLSLREALQKVAYAAAKADVRAFMNGVWIEANCVVATDGFRLAMCPTNIDLPAGLAIGIHNASVKPVIDRLTEGATFNLLRNDSSGAVVAIEVGTPANELRATLMDTKMADWRRIVGKPTGSEGVVSAKAPALAAAMARILPFSLQEINGHSTNMVDMTVKDSDIVIRPGNDETTEDHAPCTLEGPAPDVRLNAGFLSDAIGLAKGADIVWTSGGAVSPQCFEFVGRDDAHYIMPMRR